MQVCVITVVSDGLVHDVLTCEPGPLVDSLMLGCMRECDDECDDETLTEQFRALADSGKVSEAIEFYQNASGGRQGFQTEITMHVTALHVEK